MVESKRDDEILEAGDGSKELRGPSARRQLELTFSIEGDVRFISHHDTLRLFRRAFARAGLPVYYSEGFNPHPRISLPVPRPLGIASDCECLVVELAGPVDPEEVTAVLNRQMPTGIRIARSEMLALGRKRVPMAVRYGMPLSVAEESALRARVVQLQAHPHFPIERVHHLTGRARRIELADFLADLEITDVDLRFTLRITPEGTVKPSEALTALGLEGSSMNHWIRRLEIVWQ